MITDYNSHLGSIFDAEAFAHWENTGTILERIEQRYFEVMENVDRAIVVAFPQGPHMNNNEPIAHFASKYPNKIAPFFLIDPTKPDCADLIDKAVTEWNAKGFHMAPIYQKFRPDDEAYFPIYEKLEKIGKPLMWFQGSSFEAVDGPLEWANPILLDKVARNFSELRMIVAHFGSPFFREVIAMLRKHKNFYTEMSALSHRTWALYNALIDAKQYSVLDKVLFGSEFPMQLPQQSMDGLAAVAALTEGTNLPALTQGDIDSLLHRDCFEALGIKLG